MTEVTSYPHAHHRFGGYSHRLLAPAPEHRPATGSNTCTFFPPDLFRDTLLAPMDYQNQYGLPRSSSSDDRSMSVSSTASSASRHTSFNPQADSRTLSPASMLSEPASSVLSRTQHQLSLPHHQHHQQPSYASPAHTLTPPSTLLPGSGASQYYQAQLGQGPQISLYPQDPPPRLPLFNQQSPYHFQYTCLPPQPSPLSIHSYPPIYPSYAPPSTYRPLPTPGVSYHHRNSPRLIQIQADEPDEIDDRPCRLMQMPPEVLKLIRENVGYLWSTRLLGVSRWFKHNFDAVNFSAEDLIVGVAEAEKFMKRYHLTGKSAPREIQLQSITPSDSYACYHCFKMRSPENFELFIWHFQTAATGMMDDRDNNDGDDTDSHHSTTTTTASGPSTPRQRHPSLSNSSSSSTNPYYDPTITRSSILEAQAAARGSNNNNNNRSNSPATPFLGFASPASSSEPSAGGPPLAGRVKSTFGIRRFCIDCGVRKGYYKSKDLIEVHGGKNLVKWVCGCLRVRVRSVSPSCGECGLHSPYEPPGGRRRIS